MTFRKKESVVFSIGCSLVLCMGVGFAEQNVTSESTADHINQSSGSPTASQSQGGYRAYIDPDTGKLTSPPPDEVQTRQPLPLSLEEQNAASTSHKGFYQEVIPGKGVRLDLQGRFQNSVFATEDDTGKASITHSIDAADAKHPTEPLTPADTKKLKRPDHE